jgi:hypothetical protein
MAVIHHEGWLRLLSFAVLVDMQAAEEGVMVANREARRVIDAAQPFADKALTAAPVHHDLRIKSDELRWTLQRRLGLYVADALRAFLEARQSDGVPYDPLGDTLLNDKRTDKSAPHNAALRKVHDAVQSTTTAAVIMGDKTSPDLYKDIDAGHVPDIAERGAGHGGGDLIIEIKAYSGVTLAPPSPHGASIGFGGVEEHLLRKVLGVEAREGPAWDDSTGRGGLARVKADYDDSIHARHATVALFILNHFGGVNPTGVRLMHRLKARTTGTHAIDRTDYVQGGPTAWLPHWMERVAVATVKADARRALDRLPLIAEHAANTRRARALLMPPPAPPPPPAAGGG